MFLENMKQTTCLLPVRCKQCNAVFDLWYDLQELEHEQEYQHTSDQSLCWRCREAAQEESSDWGEEAEENANEESTYTVILQYE